MDALLEALRQAVATRCRCIEERRQQQQPTTSQHERSPQEQARAPRPLPPPAPTLPLPPPAPVLPLLPPATVLILFSGGLDSTLLAALAHEALPPDVPIDLASICFDGGVSPDRQSALDALQELRALAPLRQWRLIQVWLAACGAAAAAAQLAGLHAAAVQRRLCGAPSCPVLLPLAHLPRLPCTCHTSPPRRWTAPWPMWRLRSSACCACWPLPTQ